MYPRLNFLADVLNCCLNIYDRIFFPHDTMYFKKNPGAEKCLCNLLLLPMEACFRH